MVAWFKLISLVAEMTDTKGAHKKQRRARTHTHTRTHARTHPHTHTLFSLKALVGQHLAGRRYSLSQHAGRLSLLAGRQFLAAQSRKGRLLLCSTVTVFRPLLKAIRQFGRLAQHLLESASACCCGWPAWLSQVLEGWYAPCKELVHAPTLQAPNEAAMCQQMVRCVHAV